MKLTFLGDVHGKWDELQKTVDANPDTDLFVQVGDFGILPRCGIFPPQEGFGRPMWFIDGNHDDHSFLQRLAEDKLEIVPNLHYIPRSTHLKVGKTRINTIGGALSIDRAHRVEGVSWWREEIPSTKEINAFAELPRADIVISHTAPERVVQKLLGQGAGYCPDPTSQMLDRVFELCHQPKLWIFGHWHTGFDMTLEGTRFVCLPCVHPWEGHEGHTGFTWEGGKCYQRF